MIFFYITSGKNNRFFFFKSYMVILRELKHCKPFNFKTSFIFYGLFVVK